MRPAVVAIWLIVFVNGPLFFIEREVFGLPGSWEGPVFQPVLVVAVAVGVGFVVLDRARLDGRRLCDVPAVALLAAVLFGGWAAASTWWSLQPDISLWRGALYAGLPFVAWVIADLDFDRALRALGLGFGLVVAASLTLVVVWPAYALDRNNDWRGIMTNRNGLAPVCALALLVAVAGFWRGHRRSSAALAWVAFVVQLGSGSRTAWFALALALGAATVLTVGRQRYLRAPDRRVVLTAGAVAGFGAATAAAALSVLWNQSTFVQRRTIWDLVGDRIADDPWFGVGWEAFWYTPELHTDELLTRGSAHGSIPELLLGLGPLGLLLWGVVVGSAVVGVVRAVWRDPGPESWLWAALVAFLVVENLTESFVLWFSYNWVLLISAALRFGPGPRLRPARRTPVPTAAATG